MTIDQELFLAVCESNLLQFRFLLSVRDGVNGKTSDGSTHLIVASLRDHVQVVIELLEHGADVNTKDDTDWTALHWAIFEGHLAIVKALVSGGADILAANNTGSLPIHYAVSQGHSAVSKHLFQQLYATTRHLPLHELVEDITWIGDPNSSEVPPLHNHLLL
jgi:ankyrin repeat protein